MHDYHDKLNVLWCSPGKFCLLCLVWYCVVSHEASEIVNHYGTPGLLRDDIVQISKIAHGTNVTYKA